MNRIAHQVGARLSLRKPQKESLDILARIGDLFPLKKGTDVASVLASVRADYPQVEDFERDFPSLCFALATGVGKTRLMGAFIAYLHLAKGVRHFFVVAPNLTIYEKLKTDFTPNTPKYVLDGIAEFAVTPPVIVTGDDYEQGRGVRGGGLFNDEAVHINIFNISKINAEVRGGQEPRIKRLQEYIGTSYFEYLAVLPDLVLLMDESHRYRASAGVRALNELRPVLGLELTATPQIERGNRTERFKNIIFDYPLGRALDDGLVKRPAVATRENFDPAHYDEAKLERLKLEDGIRIHETVKVELAAYASRYEKRLVKPFVLVVAQDTEHADALVALIKSAEFFEGRYRDKVITVHSNQRGEERDETIQALLRVEDPAEPTEIVVHVNKLGEGWDVTNLYTIIPLRAANSRNLVEQSIGRGLRLPYGTRTGDPVVDRLTIVAHDRFQEIIDEANRPGSLLHWDQVVVGKDVPLEPKIGVELLSPFEAAVQTGSAGAAAEAAGAEQEVFVFQEGAEQQIAKATAEVVSRHFQYLPRSADLKKPEVLEKLVQAVERSLAPGQLELTVDDRTDVAKIVAKAVEALKLRNIDIPKITVVPTGEVRSGFGDFDLKCGVRGWEPVPDDILIQHLRSNERTTLASGSGVVPEERPENYIVRRLIDFDDVAYERDGTLLYKLAGQLVAHLRGYLSNEEDVLNVLQYHERSLAEFIHRQMEPHYWEHAVAYEARVHDGFEVLRGKLITGDGTSVRDVRHAANPLSDTRRYRFGWFKKNLYAEAKFDSDPERRMAVLLEDTKEVLKWFRPEGAPPHIDWANGRGYEPDFVVETGAEKFLIEVKAENEMNDLEVLAKAKAAGEWCTHASAHAVAHKGKPWAYLLVPDSAVNAAATLAGLRAKYFRA